MSDVATEKLAASMNRHSFVECWMLEHGFKVTEGMTMEDMLAEMHTVLRKEDMLRAATNRFVSLKHDQALGRHSYS